MQEWARMPGTWKTKGKPDQGVDTISLLIGILYLIVIGLGFWYLVGSHAALAAVTYSVFCYLLFGEGELRL